MLRDEFGDGFGGDPWTRPIHLTLTVSLDRMPLHAGLVMLFGSHECRRTVLVVILGYILGDADHHLVRGLSSLLPLLCLRNTLFLLRALQLNGLPAH